MVEQLIVLRHLVIQVVRRRLRIQQLAQPHHAQQALHGRRLADPVVRAERHLVIPVVRNRADVLPDRVLAHGVVDAVLREDNHVRVPVQDLLHVHLVAGALGGDVLHDGHVVGHHVDHAAVVSAVGQHVQAILASGIKHVHLLHALHHLHGAAVNPFAGLSEHARRLLQAQQLAQHGVGLIHVFEIRGDMHERNARLLGERVHVLRNAVLGLADIDDHLRRGFEQLLQVQIALAAIELAQHRQVVVLFVEVRLGGRIPGTRNAHEHVRRDGKDDDLAQRAGHGDSADLLIDGHLASGRIGKDAAGGLRASCQRQRGNQKQRERKRSEFLHTVLHPFRFAFIGFRCACICEL